MQKHRMWRRVARSKLYSIHEFAWHVENDVFARACILIGHKVIRGFHVTAIFSNLMKKCGKQNAQTVLPFSEIIRCFASSNCKNRCREILIILLNMINVFAQYYEFCYEIFRIFAVRVHMCVKAFIIMRCA
jgi:hypothetical protein